MWGGGRVSVHISRATHSDAEHAVSDGGADRADETQLLHSAPASRSSTTNAAACSCDE